jgi:hypothetical protein
MPPAIKGHMERVFSLTLQRLKAQLTLQIHLIGLQMGFMNHRVQEGKQLGAIEIPAFHADQQAIFVGVAAQTCATTLHEIGHLHGIEGATAASQDGCQQLMRPPLADWISSASASDPQFGSQHTWCLNRIQNQIGCAHSESSGKANRVKA